MRPFAWRFNADRIDAFFNALSQNQLEQEIAPGRNRLIYLWGHIAAVNDGLFPLLGLGPKLYPEMEAMFIANPDRAAVTIYSAEQVKGRGITSMKSFSPAYQAGHRWNGWSG